MHNCVLDVHKAMRGEWRPTSLMTAHEVWCTSSTFCLRYLVCVRDVEADCQSLVEHFKKYCVKSARFIDKSWIYDLHIFCSVPVKYKSFGFSSDALIWRARQRDQRKRQHDTNSINGWIMHAFHAFTFINVFIIIAEAFHCKLVPGLVCLFRAPGNQWWFISASWRQLWNGVW